jgi:MFS transporter, DHA1 family, inner membrane transport protein
MKFFSNSAINLSYIHSGLQTFAENVGGIFVFVFLLKSGISAPTIFATLGAIFLLRIIFRRTVVPVVKRIGLRNGLIVGTTMVALSYLLVAQVDGVGPILFVFIVFDALSTTFYWTCHHAFLAKLGDNEYRGSQVSVREAINAVMGIVAPLFGSFLLIYGGKGSAFLVAALVEVLAIVPLLGTLNPKIANHAVIDPATIKYARRLFGSDGVTTAFFFFTWIMALFQTLGENFGSFGGTIALASLVGAVMSLVMGRVIDLGHHKRSVQFAYGAIAISIIFKAFAFTTPWAAIAATAFAAVAAPIYMPVLMTRVYNMAKSSACPLRFQVAAEGAWDMGTGFGCLVTAGFLWLGLGYFWPLLMGLVGVGMGYKLMVSEV